MYKIRFAVVARDKNDQEDLEKRVKKRKHKIASSPDFVLCQGGDGTLLIAERKYPSVPKIQIKDSDICKTCPGYDTPVDEVLHKIEEEKFDLHNHSKLEARWIRNGRTKGIYKCVNDFLIRNELIIQAIRFSIHIDGEPAIAEELIGDGVVISSPFGSGAYYKSITKKGFDEGIGIALNNCTVPQRGIHVADGKKIVFKLTRMHADFGIDNDLDIKTLEPGDELIITKSSEEIKLVSLH